MTAVHPRVPGPQAQNRPHKRQNSTPAIFDTQHNTPALPNSQTHRRLHAQQRAKAHRRGMSHDVRLQMQLSPTQQGFTMVRTATNNTGSTIISQQVMTEAQQQSIARPGPQQTYANLTTGENYSPQPTPMMPNFEHQQYFSDVNVSNDMDVLTYGNGLATPDLSAFNPSMQPTQNFQSFPQSPITSTGWMPETEDMGSRRNSRRISNGIADRFHKFENMGREPVQRPLTPPKQNEAGYLPMTPSQTPHGRVRFSQGYDETNEETVRPIRKPARSQTTFDAMRQAAETQATNSAQLQRSNTMPTTGSFDPSAITAHEWACLGQTPQGGLQIKTDCGDFQSPSFPLSASSSFSRPMSPATPNLADQKSAFDFSSPIRPHHTPVSAFPDIGEGQDTVRGPRSSLHRRGESNATLASALSIADIDIEQTRTETGITLEEIQQYIRGPDPKDNKYICTFEGCNKKFGRKENIKSHVQTHLNDRQYQCPECKKCFVRQHDLKRHAKIHTGIKPYPCECGNRFARHDALTRHKQRGMCVGAFDGIVKKPVKRGRPRKARPDDDERMDKSARTRRRNKTTNSVSSISSQSGMSDSSAVNSPEHMEDFDMLDDIMDVSLGGTTMNPGSLQAASSTAPMPILAVDPPVSVHSPASTHSCVSAFSHMSMHPSPHATADQPSQHASPENPVVASPACELPDLSHDSSPPSTSNYYDTDPSSSGLDLLITSAGETSGLTSMIGLGVTDIGEYDSRLLMMDAADAKFDSSYDPDLFLESETFLFGE
ncbi:hypothetical protein GGR57DRAFT_471847 [Xylariaceae sp. FL1272]|nr:hypothetical protein GGR57DRAFT_471847 [Xylariaceae sp. FL1272]